jgi:formylglycine-generating enzyme required for sulfatase activity
VLEPPKPTEGRSRDAGEPRRSRKGIALAAVFLAALGIAAALLYPRGDSPDLATIERARQDAERRAADAEERARKESERAKQEAEARAKSEAARNEDLRREADAAKARAVEIARKEAEEKTKLAALRSDEPKREAAAALARKEAEDRSRADAARKADEARKAEEARKPEKSRAEQASRQAHKPGTVFRDCSDCPQMVVIPAGEFTMGSPASETGRFDHEGPQRAVRIQPFALGRNEVTFAEFERFAAEAGYKTEAERTVGKQGCFGFDFSERLARKEDWQPRNNWRDPGFDRTTNRDPVVCVSWNDAKAYIRWLTTKTGKIYRLPTEAEWEYAARAGTKSARYWGDDPNQACVHENVADRSTHEAGTAPKRTWSWPSGRRHECDDGRYLTAPVGSYRANGFGLYDMLGNVGEWTEDCWTASYKGAPADDSAWLTGDCSRRVVRGGSWIQEPRYARSANRTGDPSDFRRTVLGFRLARTLE